MVDVWGEDKNYDLCGVLGVNVKECQLVMREGWTDLVSLHEEGHWRDGSYPQNLPSPNHTSQKDHYDMEGEGPLKHHSAIILYCQICML